MHEDDDPDDFLSPYDPFAEFTDDCSGCVWGLLAFLFVVGISIYLIA